MQTFADRTRTGGKTIAFVPTMGYLHEGHASLIRDAAGRGDEVVVSIFVNPTQFGPGEDLEAYPRDFERDRKLSENAGAGIIFFPTPQEMYGKNFQTFVQLEKLPMHLCGLSRPVHFRGVATVVSKLFHIVKPHIAIFGQKDWQQLQVIRQMVRDMNFDIEIIGAPIVREADGLAMSSRNVYLNPEQRKQALCLYQSLLRAKEMLKNGTVDTAEIIHTADGLISACPEAKTDYISICDPETLEELKTVDRPALMALAVKVGKTRLIDNMMVNAEL